MSKSEIDANPVSVNPLANYESTFICGMNYDPTEEIMEVRIERDGTEVSYFYEASVYRFEEFCDAESYGKFFQRKIKRGNTSKYRDWDNNGEEMGKQQLQELLVKSTTELYNLISENDSEFVAEHTDLMESLKRRSDDSFVLDVEDKGVMDYTYHFRHLIINNILELLIEKHSSNCSWVSDCIEIADNLSSQERSIMVANTI